MANTETDHPLGCADLPIIEGAAPGVREAAPTFVLRPTSESEAEMLREIDAIQERLRAGIPRLHR
jgi:hypothetical protein